MASDRDVPSCASCDGDGASAVVVELRGRRRDGQLAWAWQGCVLCGGSGVDPSGPQSATGEAVE